MNTYTLRSGKDPRCPHIINRDGRTFVVLQQHEPDSPADEVLGAQFNVTTNPVGIDGSRLAVVVAIVGLPMLVAARFATLLAEQLGLPESAVSLEAVGVVARVAIAVPPTSNPGHLAMYVKEADMLTREPTRWSVPERHRIRIEVAPHLVDHNAHERVIGESYEHVAHQTGLPLEVVREAYIEDRQS